MNRASRRSAARQAPPAIREYAAAYRCPDCMSETGELWHDGRIWQLDVRHDSSCPLFRRLKAKGCAS